MNLSSIKAKLNQEKFSLGIGILFLVFNVLLWIGTSKFGLGLSVDSANYFSAAESFSKGLGFIQFDDFPYLNAPPLYPLLLSVAYFTGISPHLFALGLQFISFNVSLFFIYQIVSRNFSKAAALFVVALLGGFFFNYQQLFTYALSEPGFVAILMAFSYFELFKPKHHKVLIPVLFLLLCMQRYEAWFLLPGLLFFWFKQKENWKAILWKLSPAILVTLLWFLRNYLLAGTALGEHGLNNKFGPFAPLANVKLVLSGLVAFNPLYAAILLFFICLVFGVLNQKVLSGKQKELNFFVLSLSISLLVFLFLQNGLAMVQLPRYISVMWFLLLLLPMLFIFQLEWNKKIVFGLLSLFVLVQFAADLKRMRSYSYYGVGGYHERYWNQKQTNINKQDLSSGELISNYPDMVYWYTGRHCIYTPFKEELETTFLARTKGPKKLIWFTNEDRNEVMKNAEEWFNKQATSNPILISGGVISTIQFPK